MHIIVADVECSLESTLPIFKHDQIELLFDLGLGVIVLEQVRCIFPPLRFFQDSIPIETLDCLNSLGEFMVRSFHDLVRRLEMLVYETLSMALVAVRFHFRAKLIELIGSTGSLGLHDNLDETFGGLQ